MSLARTWPVKETVSPSACDATGDRANGTRIGRARGLLLQPATDAATRINVPAMTVRNRPLRRTGKTSQANLDAHGFLLEKSRAVVVSDQREWAAAWRAPPRHAVPPHAACSRWREGSRSRCRGARLVDPALGEILRGLPADGRHDARRPVRPTAAPTGQRRARPPSPGAGAPAWRSRRRDLSCRPRHQPRLCRRAGEVAQQDGESRGQARQRMVGGKARGLQTLGRAPRSAPRQAPPPARARSAKCT